MRDEAEKRIGHLYPKIEITPEIVAERPDLAKYRGQKLTVIAWLWARTVKSPNPAFAHVDVPLASTFMLSTKAGKEAYVETEVKGDSYRFKVKTGKPADAEAAKNGTKLGRGANFRCVMSEIPISPAHIYSEANAGLMGARLMAIVAEGDRGRVYLAPTCEMEEVAKKAAPTWKPDVAMPENPRWFSPPLYGLKTYGDLFTPRQLVALTTFTELVQEARAQALRDALAAGLADDGMPLAEGGIGAAAYADAVAVYLAMAISRLTDLSNSATSWNNTNQNVRQLFARQAIPMTWDFVEANPFGGGASLESVITSTTQLFASLPALAAGLAIQEDAAKQRLSQDKVISTDPPYYDNIGYADLSDFFYVWLRRSLQSVYPEVFLTLVTPKTQELVASRYRFATQSDADSFFLEGMTEALSLIASQMLPVFPTTIYYALKETEKDESGSISSGWSTFLEAVIRSGLAITGTWPVRTERTLGIKGQINALASSIVLVCRPQPANATTATRREFVNELRTNLPRALIDMQRGNIAPVDLAQAAIGPGMAIFTRYREVIDAEGKPLTVRQALALINQVLDEVQAAQEGDFDAETRWAITWFEQDGFAEGEYGVAETLSKSKNTSVSGMVEAGIIESGRGKVRLLRPRELDPVWDPLTDYRRTVWEMTHHLIRTLETGGESAASNLAARIGAQAETARELAYRLYTISERKKRAADALSYNSLVQSWPEITRLTQERRPVEQPAQAGLL